MLHSTQYRLMPTPVESGFLCSPGSCSQGAGSSSGAPKMVESDKFDKYIELAGKLGIINAVLISPKDIVFDIRAMLKCRWGCEYYSEDSVKCGTRNTSFAERVQMVSAYEHVLLLHSHDAGQVSCAVHQIERAAFLDGHYFAFAIQACNLCVSCAVKDGNPCVAPEKVRPCDQAFGIDVYRTVRNLGLPCEVLQSKTDTQNRYGFVLLC
jgi:predicted metal-binding protein